MEACAFCKLGTFCRSSSYEEKTQKRLRRALHLPVCVFVVCFAVAFVMWSVLQHICLLLLLLLLLRQGPLPARFRGQVLHNIYKPQASVNQHSGQSLHDVS